MRTITALSLLIPDYDEAIRHYCHDLGFHLIEDTQLSDDKRWVVVSPNLTNGVRLILSRATTADQMAQIGHQAGGKVFLFLETDDFQRDYEAFCNKGIIFTQAPRQEIYGQVCVFRDAFGNLWDLIEPSVKDTDLRQ